MSLCSGCGSEVVMVAVQAGAQPTVASSLWGVPVPFERLMSRAGGALRRVQHLCRDYVDWHRTVPDRRAVDTLELPPVARPGVPPLARAA
jgi:hypothetical protein